MSIDKRVAVIGAGVSGLTLAEALHEKRFEVHVFDKARGPAGRCSTRRGEAGMDWDHGAQFFTCRSTIFQQKVNQWMAKGIVKPWEMKLASISPDSMESVEDDVNRYVGVPKMNSFCKAMAEDLQIFTGSRIVSIQRETLDSGETGWMITNEADESYGPYGKLVLAIPSIQAEELLEAGSTFHKQVKTVSMLPTWALLMRVNAKAALPDYEAAYVQESPIAWIARNSKKPGREALEGVEHWIAHASHEWSMEHLEESKEDIREHLLEAIQALPGCAEVEVIEASAHRWRYAAVDQVLEEPCLWEPDLGLGLCGDWCIAGRVEGAYLSGYALSRMIRGDQVAVSEFEVSQRSGSAG